MKKWIVKDNCLPALMTFFIIVFPWITIKSDIYISESERVLFDNRVHVLLDLFLYGKSVFLLVFAIIFALILLYVSIKKREEIAVRFVKKEILLLLIGVFFLLNFLSLILADYKDVAFRGNSNSLEGFLSLICYLVIFLAAIVSFSKEENLNYLKFAAIMLGIITIVLTLFEVLNEPISKIVIGDSWSSDYNNMTTLTFYNTVYFAVFLVMLTSIVFAMFLFEKNIKLSFLIGFIFIGLIFANLSTRSTMALYVTVLIVVILIIVKIILFAKNKIIKSEQKIVNSKNNIKESKHNTLNSQNGLIKLFVPICFIIAFIIINAISNNVLSETLFSTSSNINAAIHKENYYELCDIASVDGSIVFTGEDSSFILSVDENNNIKFDSAENMNMYMDGNYIRFMGEFEAVSAWFEGGYLALDLGYKDPLYFGFTDEGVVPVKTDGTIVESMSGNDLGLNRFYDIATGRGYYWVNSLPIIKDCIVIGHGMGTFGLYFNQSDYIGNLNTHGTVLSVVDHPHNMYIQIAVQSGLISLIAVIALFVLGLICGIKKVKALESTENKGFMIGVLLAALGFMICSVTTDSMLTSTPIFCVVFAVLFAFEEEKIESKKRRKKK